MESTVYWAILAMLGMSALIITPIKAQVDGSCVESLFNDVAACFSKENLDLALQSGQQDATKLMRETQAMDPSIQCQQLGSYKRAINCSLMVLKRCLDSVSMGGSIPDPIKFQQGMDKICEKQTEFDSDCLKGHYSHILSCGEETVKRVVQERQGDQNMNINEIICLSSDVNYDCSRKHLRHCKNATLEIYLEQLNKYQVPSACVNRPPGRPGRESYVYVPEGDTAAASVVLLGSLTAVVSLLLHLLLRQ